MLTYCILEINCIEIWIKIPQKKTKKKKNSGNLFENAVWKMSDILLRPQWVEILQRNVQLRFVFLIAVYLTKTSEITYV